MTAGDYEKLAALMAEESIAVRGRFEAVDRHFEAVDRRFESVDQRFESVDQRLSRVEVTMEKILAEVRTIGEGIGVLDRKIEVLRADMVQGFKDVRSEMAAGFEAHHRRLVRLEEKAWG